MALLLLIVVQVVTFLLLLGCARGTDNANDNIDRNGEQSPIGFVVRYGGQELVTWPRWLWGSHGHSTLAGERHQGIGSTGFFFLSSPGGASLDQSGTASESPVLRRFSARGRTAAGGPFGATGLLDLPLTRRPQRCAVGERLLNLGSVINAREEQDQVPTSIVSLVNPLAAGGAVAEDESCRLTAVLDCLTATFAALPRLAGREHPALGLGLEGPLDGCFRRSGTVGVAADGAYFGISGDRLVFAPERVFSVLIYEGSLPNLAAALASGPPVAVVPLLSGCGEGEEEFGCRFSPLAVTECIGCDKLIMNQVYGAFLVLKPGVLDETVKPVAFSVVE